MAACQYNNILFSLVSDIIEHHLWPLLTDHDAIHLMQVDHSMCAYYEERVYGLKLRYTVKSDAELDAAHLHLTVGRVRSNRQFMSLQSDALNVSIVIH